MNFGSPFSNVQTHRLEREHVLLLSKIVVADHPEWLTL